MRAARRRPQEANTSLAVSFRQVGAVRRLAHGRNRVTYCPCEHRGREQAGIKQEKQDWGPGQGERGELEPQSCPVRPPAVTFLLSPAPPPGLVEALVP